MSWQIVAHGRTSGDSVESGSPMLPPTHRPQRLPISRSEARQARIVFTQLVVHEGRRIGHVIDPERVPQLMSQHLPKVGPVLELIHRDGPPDGAVAALVQIDALVVAPAPGKLVVVPTHLPVQRLRHLIQPAYPRVKLPTETFHPLYCASTCWRSAVMASDSRSKAFTRSGVRSISPVLTATTTLL